MSSADTAAFARGAKNYSRGSIDRLEGRKPKLYDDEDYMTGWFAREASEAWGDHETMTVGVKRRLAAALAMWNEWRREHDLPDAERLPL